MNNKITKLSHRVRLAPPRIVPPRLVPPGQRIVRSVIAVWLCMVVYFLRGMTGDPFYSIIAALQCVQPYSSNMLQEGRDRIIGTMIGAFWGAAILFLELLPADTGFESTLMFFILLGVFSGLVIYSTVLLNIQQYALFATVVFLGIAMYHIGDANPYIHIFYRTFETIIGVGIAIAINSVHLPRVPDKNTLFVSGIDHVLFREDRELSRYTKVEINRFLDEGMRFSVSTMQTPATVREVLSGINLRLPIIAMDGAVLYDLHTMKYVRTEKIAPDVVTLISDFLHSEGIPFFVNTVKDNLLVIYFKDYKDLLLEKAMDAHHGSAPRTEEEVSESAYISMARLYHKKRVSPYRNYVRTNEPITEDVIYILVIDHEQNIERLHQKFMLQPWADRCRVNFDTFDCEKGERIMRIYTAGSSRREMLRHLQRYVGAPHVFTFGTGEDECDYLIDDAGRDQLVKALKKKFEPVNIKGWRNIIHM